MNTRQNPDRESATADNAPRGAEIQIHAEMESFDATTAAGAADDAQPLTKRPATTSTATQVEPAISDTPLADERVVIVRPPRPRSPEKRRYEPSVTPPQQRPHDHYRPPPELLNSNQYPMRPERRPYEYRQPFPERRSHEYRQTPPEIWPQEQRQPPPPPEDLRMRDFERDDPEEWFATFERRLRMFGIHEPEVQQSYLVHLLPSDVYQRVRDVINCRNIGDPYLRVRDALLSRFGVPKETQFVNYLAHARIRTQETASGWLAFLRKYESYDVDIIRALFLSGIDRNTRAELMTTSRHLSLEE